VETPTTTASPASSAEDPPLPSGATSLDDVAKQLGINPTELPLRSEIARSVVKLFTIINLAVLAGLAMAMLGDFVMLWAHIYGPAERLVTPTVLTRLIEASAVQAGAFALIIARGLFPVARKSGGEPSKPPKSNVSRSPQKAANDTDPSKMKRSKLKVIAGNECSGRRKRA
jgi:hypothetical protein